MSAYPTDMALSAAYDFQQWLILQHYLTVKVERPEKKFYFRSFGDLYRNAKPEMVGAWYLFLQTDGNYLSEDIPANKRLYELILEMTAYITNSTDKGLEAVYKKEREACESDGWRFVEKLTI
jgi:hypothetical protein